MAILYTRGPDGSFIPIPAIVGPPGKDGADGAPGKDGAQGLQGPQGEPGNDGKDGVDGAPGKDGYTPVKGVDYFDGKDGEPGAAGPQGEPGKDGTPGRDGFSPAVSVAGIDGGHRVTITDAEGAKSFDVLDGKDGEGGSGGGSAIIDVVELPTENIIDNVFYRVLTASFICNQERQNKWNCYCVEELPAEGPPAFSGDLTDASTVVVNAYYNVSDGSVNAYVTNELSYVFGVPSGWYPAAVLTGAVGFEFCGIITDLLDDPEDECFRLLLEYTVYSYKDSWTSHKTVGRYGLGANAEVFNHPSNSATGANAHAEGYRTYAGGDYAHAEGSHAIANGKYSHAEGSDTTAKGQSSHVEGSTTVADGRGSHAEGFATSAIGFASHAEGSDTTAKGQCSHAEGNATTAGGDFSHAEGNATTADGHYSHAEGEGATADGDYSHAEGVHTVAGGDYSHAEGVHTVADGHCSHAEGEGVTAKGWYQHAQGRYNVIDYDAEYAHIVGNGTSEEDRSNAHTIDWDGVGWFAGGVKVGDTGQDAEASDWLVTRKELEADRAQIVSDVLAALPTETWTFTLEDGSTVDKVVTVR